jgi:putative flippase GtrA
LADRKLRQVYIKLVFKSKFLRFALVGATATLTTYLVLILLVEIWHMNVIVASVLGYIAGIAVNYKLNYGFTFRSERQHRIVIPKFIFVALIGLLLNTGLMFVAVNWVGIHYVLAQLAAVAVVLIWSFTINRLWVFTK